MSKVRLTEHYTEEVFNQAIKDGTLESGIMCKTGRATDDEYTVRVWVDGGHYLKIGGPYKTHQTAKFAEQRMCAL